MPKVAFCDRTRLGWKINKQNSFHQSIRRRYGRRYRAEIFKRHLHVARSEPALRRGQSHSLGLELFGPTRRHTRTNSATTTCTCQTPQTTVAPDGMRVDRDGRLYVATRMGIQICDQAGRVNCIVPTPNGRVSNIAFGGEHFDSLLATCGDKVYIRKLKVKGAPHFLPPVLPATPRL